MVFLDEGVFFSVYVPQDGIYKYEVMVDMKVVFVGNVFCVGGDNDIEVTNIVSNFVPTLPLYVNENESKMVRYVMLKFYTTADDYELYSENVYMGYRQPFYHSHVSTPILEVDGETDAMAMPLLQGANHLNNTLAFTPTYPLTYSSDFTFDFVGLFDDSNFTETGFVVYSDTNQRSDLYYIGEEIRMGAYAFSQTLGDMFSQPNSFGNPSYIALEWEAAGEYNKVVVAKIIPPCEKRYFLKWQDRYGMPQVQPFGGTIKYSEGLSRSEVKNYKNVRRIVSVDIQSKWLLNTDWISERLYPFYESIFVSPYLQLYDAVEDKVYNVSIVNTEYEEKTFKNQNGNLFNLQVEVELTNKQVISY